MCESCAISIRDHFYYAARRANTLLRGDSDLSQYSIIYSFHLVPLNPLRHIRLLQVLCLFIAQLKLDRLDRLVNPLLTSEPYDRVDTFLLYRPRDSDECHTHAPLLRNLFQPIYNVLVDFRLFASDEGFEEVVGLFTLGGSITPGSGEDTAGDGRPGDAAHT